MAQWQSVRDFARGIVRIGQMEPEDVAEGNLWFDESDPRHAAKDPHSYDAHEYGKHPEFSTVSVRNHLIDKTITHIDTIQQPSSDDTARTLNLRPEKYNTWILSLYGLTCDSAGDLRMRANNNSNTSYWYFDETGTKQTDESSLLLTSFDGSYQRTSGHIIITTDPNDKSLFSVNYLPMMHWDRLTGYMDVGGFGNGLSEDLESVSVFPEGCNWDGSGSSRNKMSIYGVNRVIE